jgi:hypothetical protein
MYCFSCSLALHSAKQVRKPHARQSVIVEAEFALEIASLTQPRYSFSI